MWRRGLEGVDEGIAEANQHSGPAIPCLCCHLTWAEICLFWRTAISSRESGSVHLQLSFLVDSEVCVLILWHGQIWAEEEAEVWRCEDGLGRQTGSGAFFF